MPTVNERARARCQAAHPDDWSACEGPRDAVRIVDAQGGQASGCIRHGAVLLASLDGGRVYPGSLPGAACVVFNEAVRLEPFAFSLPHAGSVVPRRSLADEAEEQLRRWPHRRRRGRRGRRTRNVRPPGEVAR